MKLSTGIKLQVTRHDGVLVSFVIEGLTMEPKWRRMMVDKCQSIVDNAMMVSPEDIIQTARKLNIAAVEVTMYDMGGCSYYASIVEA